jgi:Kef-type K+ transport system membrane component KefB
MLPRGEVALIIAGMGLARGAIDTGLFGVVIMMTVVTTFLAPVLLVPAFRGGDGLRSS